MAKKNNPFEASLDLLSGGDGINVLMNQKPNNATLKIEDIIVKSQIREEFENEDNSLNDLAESIKDYGIIEPLVVRSTDEGFVLVAGERRLRASILAGLESVPVTIQYVDEDKAEIIQFLENILRKDLTLMEEAKRLKKMQDKYGSVGEVLKIIKKNKFWFSKRIAILSMPEQAKRLADSKAVSDVKLIHEVREIERVDPSAAKEAVDKVLSKDKKVKARDIVGEYKNKIVQNNGSGKKDKSKKAPPQDIVNKPSSVSSGSSSSILEKAYMDLSDTTATVEFVLREISKEDLELVESKLNTFYLRGQLEEQKDIYILKELRSRNFSYVDFRVFFLIAFLQGIENKEFSVNNIFECYKAFSTA